MGKSTSETDINAAESLGQTLDGAQPVFIIMRLEILLVNDIGPHFFTS